MAMAVSIGMSSSPFACNDSLRTSFISHGILDSNISPASGSSTTHVPVPSTLALVISNPPHPILYFQEILLVPSSPLKIIVRLISVFLCS